MASTSAQSDTGSVAKVIVSGGILCALLLAAAIVWDMSADLAMSERPVMVVLTCYLAAFAVAMFSLRTVVRQREHKLTLKSILIFGVIFRLIMVFSTPFLEIDVYRYLWDGISLSHGVSPYRWSPEEALAEHDGTDAHQQIVSIANASDSVRTIVQTVHFPSYTTIYPPVSQVVFAGTMWFVPDNASVNLHLIAMKLVLVGFDIGTMFLVLAGLRLVRRNPHWILAYAWNPVLIKEIANSGHLDSIAVFFLSVSMLMVVRELQSDSGFRKRVSFYAAVFMSLAIGAKLFPVVLVPLFFVWIWRRTKGAALIFAGGTVAFACLVMAPMFIGKQVDSHQHKNGLSGFLSHWRMNALPFDVVYENVRAFENGNEDEPWYSVVPEVFRERMRELADRIPVNTSAPTKIARLATLSLLVVIYLAVLVRRFFWGGETDLFLKDAFVVLASFLFLQPTVNPWYWTWVLPFVCFVRKFGWHMAGGCLLLYYCRFWFKFSNSAVQFGGGEYVGVDCFDHLFVWAEYTLIFALVVLLPRLDSTPEVDSGRTLS